MTLREAAFSGVRWVSATVAVRAGLQVAQMLVLARLLTPADFGSVSVVMAVVGFLQMFADFGVSNALFHRTQTSASQLSSLFWLNVAGGVLTAAVVLVLALPAAAFYAQPILAPLLAMSAVPLLAGASWQQLHVRAERDLRFARLAQVEIGAALAGVPAAILVALSGGGAYALMAGITVSALVAAALGWLLLAEGWRPEARLRFDEIRGFLGFGGYMAGANLLNALNANADVFVGARVLGAQPVGLYSVPKSLCMQITSAVNPIFTRVGLPVMAKTAEQAGALRGTYLQILRMTASANFPLFAAVALFAPEIVHLLLGAQWDGAVTPLRILAAWALLRSTGNPVGSLLIARGRADLSFRWNLAWLAVFPVAAWAGSRHGAEGLAAAMTAVGVVGAWASWCFLVRPLCAAGFVEYFRQLAVPLALSACAVLVAWLCTLPLQGDLLRFCVGLGSGGASYFGLSLYFNPAWPAAARELLRTRVAG